MNAPDDPRRPWWGVHEIPLGETRTWWIGPLRLSITRLAHEIQITRWTEGDALAPGLRVADPEPIEPPASAEFGRFGFEQSPSAIHVAPLHADRPVVARPEYPFHLPARESATIYVSSPLWLQLRSRADAQPFYETSLFRPSDTWFGPSTRVGELCYASRTAARLNLENVPVLAQRAVAALHVRNRSAKRLDLERLKLPAPFLSLHASGDGHLWAERVTLLRRGNDDAAELELSRRPPDEAGTTAYVHAAREKPTRGALLRTFGRMLNRIDDHV
jgi:hypothetical protein